MRFTHRARKRARQERYGDAYANSFDAAKMICGQDYRAIVRPLRNTDEMVVLAKVDSDIKVLDDLNVGTIIEMVGNRNVGLIDMCLFEAGFERRGCQI